MIHSLFSVHPTFPGYKRRFQVCNAFDWDAAYIMPPSNVFLVMGITVVHTWELELLS